MVNGLLNVLLPVTLLAASLNPSLDSTATLLAPATSTQESVSNFYVVKEGDSLAQIARAYYGDEDFWTVVWNDNDWIQDPNVIEAGTKIKLRSERPLNPAELSADLQKKLGLNVPTPTPTPQTSVISLTITPPPPLVANSPTPPTPTPKQPTVATQGPLTPEQMTFLGACESGMTPTTNTGNGFYGAFQFTIETWNSMNTGYARADFAPLEVQIHAVQKLLSQASIWTQFPGCAVKMSRAGLI